MGQAWLHMLQKIFVIAPRTHQGQAVGPAGVLPLGLVVYFAVQKHKVNKFPPGEPWRTAERAALNPAFLWASHLWWQLELPVAAQLSLLSSLP